MSGSLPAYVLKDNTCYVNGVSKIGQSEEFKLPAIELKTEEMRNGGMIKPRLVSFGLNTLTASLTLSGFHPDMIGLFGIPIGEEFPLFAYGYLQSENGKSHAARAEMGAVITKFDPGSWKTGEQSPTEQEFSVNSYSLYVDEVLYAEISDFDASFGGKSIMPGRADALRLS